MLTILMIILIHSCIIAINITLLLWIIITSDDMELHAKNNAYTFCLIFCPITNILGTLILAIAIGNMWLHKCIELSNK